MKITLYEKQIKSEPIANLIFEVEQLGRERSKEIKKIQDCIINIAKDERFLRMGFGLITYRSIDYDVSSNFKLLYGNGMTDYGIYDIINDTLCRFKQNNKKLDIVRKSAIKIIAKRYEGYKLKEIVLKKSVDNANEEWEFRKMKITFSIIKVTKQGKCILLFARHNRKRWTSFDVNSKIMDYIGNHYKEGLEEARIMLEKENRYLKETYKNTMKELEPLIFGMMISEGL